MPGVKSVYKWEGKVAQDSEVLCIAKTTRSKFPDLAEHVKRNHPYDVPELIATEVHCASTDYFKWVVDTVNKK